MLCKIADVGTELAVTFLCAATAAVGGAAAGGNIGGVMAVNSRGPLAQPFGQAIGRNLGGVTGGAVGAAAIRCPSRSKATRSSSAVRFAP